MSAAKLSSKQGHSPALTKDLIFTTRAFNGVEAKNMGIVNHVVTQTEFKNAAFQKDLDLAEEILPNGPVGKLAIDKGMQVDPKTGYSIEKVCYAQIVPTKFRIEDLKAFSEKHKSIELANNFANVE